MAVRFDSSSDRYVATINGGAQTSYTFCAWVKISTLRATWVTALNLNDGTTGNSATFETNSSGNTWETLFDNGNDQGMVTATVGDWYFLACSVNGTTVNTYVKPLGGSISNSSTATIAASGVTASQFWLGEWPDLGQWLNGCLAGVKLWLGAALSQTELDTEAGQLMPVRTTNLKCAYPLDVAETTDHSGNGFTLTASGTPTTEASPTGIPLGTLGGGGGGGTTVSFGKTTDGTGTTASSATKITVSPATPTSSGTLVAGHARVWLSATGSAGSKLVVYSDSSGSPATLLATSDEVTVTSTTADTVHDYTFSGGNQISLVSGTPYHIGIMWADPGTPSFTHSRDATANMRWERSASAAPTWTYPSAPTSFGTPEGPFSGPSDVWLDYTESAATGPSPGRRLLAAL